MLVKQTMLSQNGSSLLDYAISRLRPDVFSHPVWVGFGKKAPPVSRETINNLFSTAKDLRVSDPSAACQVLLICAVYQNHVGQWHNALRAAQQALALAQHCGLSKETIWAIWGECAISIQGGNFEQAAYHLVDLQAVLSEQNEWILSDFVDVLKQCLFQLASGGIGNDRGFPSDRPFGDFLVCIFDWLQKWGVSVNTHEPEFEANKLAPKESIAPDTTSRELKTEKFYGNHISEPAAPALLMAVHMLGPFSMTIDDLTLRLPVSRGLAILKYLLLHHKQSIPREVLMDIFWPDAEPEAARNNLNVALYNLRRAVRKFTDLPLIVFEAGTYGLAPNPQVWLDVEEFERCVKAGQRLEAQNQLTTAVTKYEAAISLYQGDFLEQCPYEEWTIPERERLQIIYLDILYSLGQIYLGQKLYAACITVCRLVLSRDRCQERAHCLLMRCYSYQGQYHLALRQFQDCVEALLTEFETEPALETIQLYERICRHEQV